MVAHRQELKVVLEEEAESAGPKTNYSAALADLYDYALRHPEYAGDLQVVPVHEIEGGLFRKKPAASYNPHLRGKMARLRGENIIFFE